MNFVDLFCGIGGFRIAFEAQNATCVFSSDVDKIEAYEKEIVEVDTYYYTFKKNT